MFINYAHRGASTYAPENTFAAFYLGCRMGANGIETDIQQTKDGVLVLFHDKNLLRIANRPEAICDLTYEELMQIDVGIHKGEEYAGERVPTLEEFLRHFSKKPLHFALEIKQSGIEADVLEMLSRYPMDERLIVTSFQWESLLEVRRLAPEIRTGYLTREMDDSILEQMLKAGIWQYCPKADLITEERAQMFRKAGFSLRAWGVANEELMNRMLAMGMDGMTVNFPDKLTEALKTISA